MATPTDLSRVADRVFYMAGGYKYAMSGEGVCFLHAPPGFGPRPVVTGWFAEFGHLEGPPGGVQYRTDGGRFWVAESGEYLLTLFDGDGQELLPAWPSAATSRSPSTSPRASSTSPRSTSSRAARSPATT